jgi:hypothetical protein
MTEAKPQTPPQTPETAVAQALLADVVRQLKVLHYMLLGIAASLPLGDAAAFQIRADIECVLTDSLAPAITSLEQAGHPPAPDPAAATED